MHVISRKKLREYWAIHPDTEEPLATWFRIVDHVEWQRFADMRITFGKRVDRVGECFVFDVHGGHCRLITRVSPSWETMFILHVLTHEEYDRGGWKKDCTS